MAHSHKRTESSKFSPLPYVAEYLFFFFIIPVLFVYVTNITISTDPLSLKGPVIVNELILYSIVFSQITATFLTITLITLLKNMKSEKIYGFSVMDLAFYSTLHFQIMVYFLIFFMFINFLFVLNFDFFNSTPIILSMMATLLILSYITYRIVTVAFKDESLKTTLDGLFHRANDSTLKAYSNQYDKKMKFNNANFYMEKLSKICMEEVDYESPKYHRNVKLLTTINNHAIDMHIEELQRFHLKFLDHYDALNILLRIYKSLSYNDVLYVLKQHISLIKYLNASEKYLPPRDFMPLLYGEIERETSESSKEAFIQEIELNIDLRNNCIHQAYLSTTKNYLDNYEVYVNSSISKVSSEIYSDIIGNYINFTSFDAKMQKFYNEFIIGEKIDEIISDMKDRTEKDDITSIQTYGSISNEIMSIIKTDESIDKNLAYVYEKIDKIMSNNYDTILTTKKIDEMIGNILFSTPSPSEKETKRILSRNVSSDSEKLIQRFYHGVISNKIAHKIRLNIYNKNMLYDSDLLSPVYILIQRSNLKEDEQKQLHILFEQKLYNTWKKLKSEPGFTPHIITFPIVNLMLYSLKEHNHKLNFLNFEHVTYDTTIIQHSCSMSLFLVLNAKIKNKPTIVDINDPLVRSNLQTLLHKTSKLDIETEESLFNEMTKLCKFDTGSAYKGIIESSETEEIMKFLSALGKIKNYPSNYNSIDNTEYFNCLTCIFKNEKK